jgi:DNA-directed RNA polymerase specialized sigma subunit
MLMEHCEIKQVSFNRVLNQLDIAIKEAKALSLTYENQLALRRFSLSYEMIARDAENLHLALCDIRTDFIHRKNHRPTKRCIGLSDREKLVLQHRSCLSEHAFYTYKELGKRLGVSMSRAREIHIRAKRKLSLLREGRQVF